jgi:beta-glucanase (GH16 family)
MITVLHKAAFAIGAVLLLSPSYAQVWEEVWSDEFSGTSPDPDTSNWGYDVGGGGWGNNELQFHTDRIENSYVQGGYLHIVARKESYRNRKYTSARLKTQNLQQFQYGKVEARIQIPPEQGAWPAFWMLGANFQETPWPDCGEIDIMEWVWSMDDSIYAPTNGAVIRGGAHGPGYSGADSDHGDLLFVSPDVPDTFHIYSIEWDASEIRYYVDYSLYFSATPEPWVFDHPFFIILNLAIGGWGGAVADTVVFPLTMLVDYVRVYEDTTMTPPPPPSGEAPLLVWGISMDIETHGPNWEAVATVSITDDTMAPVSGVTVLGAWSDLINVGVLEQVTDDLGEVIMNSGKTRDSGTIRFCVQDLVLDGYYYDALNSPIICNTIDN